MCVWWEGVKLEWIGESKLGGGRGGGGVRVDGGVALFPFPLLQIF